jgi:predicted PurR-regulated permease PerM
MALVVGGTLMFQAAEDILTVLVLVLWLIYGLLPLVEAAERPLISMFSRGWLRHRRFIFRAALVLAILALVVVLGQWLLRRPLLLYQQELLQRLAAVGPWARQLPPEVLAEIKTHLELLSHEAVRHLGHWVLWVIHGIVVLVLVFYGLTDGHQILVGLGWQESIGDEANPDAKMGVQGMQQHTPVWHWLHTVHTTLKTGISGRLLMALALALVAGLLASGLQLKTPGMVGLSWGLPWLVPVIGPWASVVLSTTLVYLLDPTAVALYIPCMLAVALLWYWVSSGFNNKKRENSNVFVPNATSHPVLTLALLLGLWEMGGWPGLLWVLPAQLVVSATVAWHRTRQPTA